jgi:ribosomal protein L22
MLTPGFPGEMPLFTRGLSEQGATVLGVSNMPVQDLPDIARRHLSDYFLAPDLFTNPEVAIEQIRRWLGSRTVDRVCCLWEPGVEIAAQIREALGVPGQSYHQALRFRNKDLMKQALAEGGVRVPHHAVASTPAEVWAAAEQLGYPLIIKPIAGAGSMDTFRCDDPAEVKQAIAQLGHIAVVDVEEFIDGEEYTYDTVCAGGDIKYFHIAFYRPRPLIARTNEWISPQTLNLVAQLIRGKKVATALADLTFSQKRIARDVKKCLESAIANAENNHDLDVDDLVVAQAFVGKALVMKRFHARARGRASRVEKPFANITIIVREVEAKA